MPAARQTRSGRTIHNTPCYEHSLTQRDQGLLAWEVLLDQDEQEQVLTAAAQYKIQKSLENPLVFAASDNLDILYWDQAMKAPDRAKFIEAVGTELDGHEKMGNYEPVPLNQVPKGTDTFLSKTPIAPCYCQMMGRTLREEIRITQYNNPTKAGKYSLEDLFRASDNIAHHYPKF